MKVMVTRGELGEGEEVGKGTHPLHFPVSSGEVRLREGLQGALRQSPPGSKGFRWCLHVHGDRVLTVEEMRSSDDETE
jgi:hypothetical protein